MLLHDFQCTSTVHRKVTQRHAAVSVRLRLTMNDLEFSAYLQGGRAKVQLKSEKLGTWRGLTASLPLCSFLQLHGSDRGGEGTACIAGH